MFSPRPTLLRAVAGVFLILVCLFLLIQLRSISKLHQWVIDMDTLSQTSLHLLRLAQPFSYSSLPAFLTGASQAPAFKVPPRLSVSGEPLANATFVVLCRNGDLGEIMGSVRQMEDRFNARHGYPWVFLNDVPFDEEFQQCAMLEFLNFSFINSVGNEGAYVRLRTRRCRLG